MRHLLPAVLACLLLAGCGAPADAAAEVPESTSAEILSAPSIVTEGQAPGEDLDLPAEVVSLYDWQTSGGQLALLAEIPAQGMALYGVAGGDAPHVLFRWDDTLAAFPDWTIDAPKSVALGLLALDRAARGLVARALLIGRAAARQGLGVLVDGRVGRLICRHEAACLLAGTLRRRAFANGGAVGRGLDVLLYEAPQLFRDGAAPGGLELAHVLGHVLPGFGAEVVKVVI